MTIQTIASEAEIPTGLPTGNYQFAEVVARLCDIVGDEHVHTDDRSLEEHSRAIIPWKKKCSVVVYPSNVEEIQEIVKIANEFKLPLWPFSGGRNWGYGSTNALQDGAVILMLRRMNRILEVNEDLAYAVIEPGVSQEQLNNYLKENNIKLWMDCTDGPPNGSVIGNALDRGVGETPYGDHFENLCGMEVVLPNGKLMRTGGGDFRNSKSWNIFKWGTGPYLEGLFSQSNFGIVTKAGIWLMPEPEAFCSYVFEINDAGHLPHVIDTIRELAFKGVIQSKIHMINDFVGLAIIGKYPHHLLDRETYLTDNVLADLRAKYNIATWSFGGGIYGTAAQVRHKRNELRKHLGRFGRLTFVTDGKVRALKHLTSVLKKANEGSVFGRLGRYAARKLFGKPLEFLEAFPHVHALLKGIPSNYFVGHAYFKSKMEKPTTDIDPARDGCGLMWAGPVVPLTGGHITEVLNIVRPLYRKYGFDFSTAFILANPRSMIALMSIFFDKSNEAESERAMELYDEMCDATADAGYQQYRTSLAYMDRIMSRNPEMAAFSTKLKNAVDPAGIIAPGRYGLG